MPQVLSRRAATPLPLVLTWQGPRRPVPQRAIRWPEGARRRTVGLEAPPWFDTGPTDRPFDLGAAIRRLTADIASRCPALAHLDVSRLLFAVTQARTGHPHGLQARVTPLRCRGGVLRRARGGVTYQVQRYVVDGVEMLYLVTFCLPRFLDQSFDDKFITLFHELYHIGPRFDGDLRRLAGRCELHSDSKREYDAHMATLARAYLAGGPDKALHDFLRLDFAQLMHRHGSVVGAVVPRPRLLPVRDEDMGDNSDVEPQRSVAGGVA